MADILAFPGNPGAPVQPFPGSQDAVEAALFDGPPPIIPRRHFGGRRPAENVGDYVKRAAQAAADVLAGRAPEPKVICASIWQETSGRCNAGAVGWRDLGRLLESLGDIRHARTCFDMADIAETMAAEVLIDIIPPEGA